MNMLQRIVNAFAGRQQTERQAREESPQMTEFSRSGPGAPGANAESFAEEGHPRDAAMEPSVAAQRLWCSAGHF